MKNISPQEAQALLQEGWTYLDVRSEPEFEQGHPAGAVNIPLMHKGPAGMTPNPDFARVVEAQFPKDSRLVVGCLAGSRSARAVQVMESMGYGQLANQRAGWGGAQSPGGAPEPGWQAQKLPTEAGAPAGRCYRDVLAKAR